MSVSPLTTLYGGTVSLAGPVPACGISRDSNGNACAIRLDELVQLEHRHFAACRALRREVVQRAFELVAEQRLDRLPVAHALEHELRAPHAIGRKIVRQHVGLVAVGVAQIGIAQQRGRRRVVDRRRMREAAAA